MTKLFPKRRRLGMKPYRAFPNIFSTFVFVGLVLFVSYLCAPIAAAESSPRSAVATSIIAIFSIDPIVKLAYYINHFSDCGDIYGWSAFTVFLWSCGALCLIVGLLYAYCKEKAADFPDNPDADLKQAIRCADIYKICGMVLIAIALINASAISNIKWTKCGCPDAPSNTTTNASCSTPSVATVSPCCQWVATEWMPSRDDSACEPLVHLSRSVECWCNGVKQPTNSSCAIVELPYDFAVTQDTTNWWGGCQCEWMYGAWSACENGLQHRSFACGYRWPTLISGNPYTLICGEHKCGLPSTPNSTMSC